MSFDGKLQHDAAQQTQSQHSSIPTYQLAHASLPMLSQTQQLLQQRPPVVRMQQTREQPQQQPWTLACPAVWSRRSSC